MSLLYHNDTIIKKEKELLRALLGQFCKLELTGESVVWSLLDETVLFSIYKVIELYFENKKGPLHFCEITLRKYSVFTK